MRLGTVFSRTSTASALACALTFAPSIAPDAIAQQAGPARPVFVDGQAQVAPAFADSATWIREALWVETEFDSYGDGQRDRGHVAVVRPRQTETEGVQVPVVYESSPYDSGTTGDRKYPWDVRQELRAPADAADSPARSQEGRGGGRRDAQCLREAGRRRHGK